MRDLFGYFKVLMVLQFNITVICLLYLFFLPVMHFTFPPVDETKSWIKKLGDKGKKEKKINQSHIYVNEASLWKDIYD